MSFLPPSASFEYLCLGSTVIKTKHRLILSPHERLKNPTMPGYIMGCATPPPPSVCLMAQPSLRRLLNIEQTLDQRLVLTGMLNLLPLSLCSGTSLLFMALITDPPSFTQPVYGG